MTAPDKEWVQLLEAHPWAPSVVGEELVGVYGGVHAITADIIAACVRCADGRRYHLRSGYLRAMLGESGIKAGDEVRVVFDGYAEAKPGQSPQRLYRVFVRPA